jgi:multimeric flavodoxin WrbA/rubredoxin
MSRWVCRACGYVHEGRKPPSECPQCSSPPPEFISEGKKRPLSYDGKPMDLLVLNGSTHAGHNMNILLEWAEKVLKKEKVKYRRVDLNSVNIEHCWCCYSIKDDACTYPCRNQGDDMPILHEMLMKSRGVLVASPINWNNMSARLKDFLDRTTSIQNLQLTKGEAPLAARPLGILVEGHEDGAYKTAHDIFHYFQDMGYILAPFGIAYVLNNRKFNAKEDHAFIKKDRKTREFVEATTKNLIKAVRLNLPRKFGKIEISSE